MDHNMIDQSQHVSRDLAVHRMPAEPTDASFGYNTGAQPAVGLSPIQVVLRRKWLILAFAVVVGGLTAVGVRQLKPRYTASAAIVVDARQLRVNGESLLPSQMLDYDLVRTRIDAARDPRLAEEVVQQLKLNDDPDYCSPQVGLSDRGLALVVGLLPPGTVPPAWLPKPADAAPCPATVTKAAQRLAPSIGIDNDGRSYTIRVAVQASSPQLAADIANAYANAFVRRQREAVVELSSQTASWLTTHLAQLRAQVIAADAAVQQARDTSQLTLQRGETVVSQRLAELNTQLTTATADLQQKRSTLRTMDAGAVDAGSIARSSPIVQRLLDRQGQLAANLADLQSRLGPDHPQVRAASAQLAQVDGQLRTETGKAVAVLRGDVDALEARRAALASEVGNLQQQVAGQGQSSMHVDDLQRDAESVRKQYDAAATRLEQIQADAATQRSDVQVIVPATAPVAPSFPRSNMITAGALLTAIGVGAAFAFVLELASRVFTTPGQVEEETSLRVLGLYVRPRSRKLKPENVIVSRPTSREAEALHATLINLLGRSFAPRGHHDPRHADPRHADPRHADPRHADPRHDDHGHASRVVMVTSAVPGEGKTSFTIALGRAARRSGLSVVVVDCDLRRSGLTHMFSGAWQGANLRADADAKDVAPVPDEPLRVAVDTASGLSLVTLTPAAPAHPHAVLGHDLRIALDRLRKSYDLVIVDTPPALALPDALSIGRLVDDTVLLTAWRSTRRGDTLSALKMLRRAHVHLTGIVMTKVDLRSLAKRPISGFHTTAYPAYHGMS